MAGDIQARNYAGDRNHIVDGDFPVVALRHAVHNQPCQFMNLGAIMGVHSTRIAKHAIINVCAERAGNWFGRAKVHIRHEERQHILGIFPPFIAFRSSPIDDLIEIHVSFSRPRRICVLMSNHTIPLTRKVPRFQGCRARRRRIPFAV